MNELERKQEILEIIRRNKDMVSLPAKVRKSKEFACTRSFSPEIGEKAYETAKSLLAGIGANNSFFAGSKRKTLCNQLEKTLLIWLDAMSQPNQRYEAEYLSELEGYLSSCDTHEESEESDSPKTRALAYLDGTVADLTFYRDNLGLEEKLNRTIEALTAARDKIASVNVTASAEANGYAKTVVSALTKIRDSVASRLFAVGAQTEEISDAALKWSRLKNLSASKIKPKELVRVPAEDDELHYYIAFVTDVEPRVNDFFEAIEQSGGAIRDKLSELHRQRDGLEREKRTLATAVKNGELHKTDAGYRAAELQQRFNDLNDTEQVVTGTAKQIVDSLSFYTDKIKNRWNTSKLTMSGEMLNKVFGGIDYNTIVSALHVGRGSFQDQSKALFDALNVIKNIDEQTEAQIKLLQSAAQVGEKLLPKTVLKHAGQSEKANESALEWLMGGEEEKSEESALKDSRSEPAEKSAEKDDPRSEPAEKSAEKNDPRSEPAGQKSDAWEEGGDADLKQPVK